MQNAKYVAKTYICSREERRRRKVSPWIQFKALLLHFKALFWQCSYAQTFLSSSRFIVEKLTSVLLASLTTYFTCLRSSESKVSNHLWKSVHHNDCRWGETPVIKICRQNLTQQHESRITYPQEQQQQHSSHSLMCQQVWGTWPAEDCWREQRRHNVCNICNKKCVVLWGAVSVCWLPPSPPLPTDWSCSSCDCLYTLCLTSWMSDTGAVGRLREDRLY